MAYRKRKTVCHTPRTQVPRVKIFANKVPCQRQRIRYAAKIRVVRESDKVVCERDVQAGLKKY